MISAAVDAQDAAQPLQGNITSPVYPHQYTHEFSLYGGGGLSTLHYRVTAGDQKEGLGGHLGLGYHLFFNPKWGIGTGIEFARYNARFIADNFNTRYMIIDPESNPFEFRSTLYDYKEKQHAGMLQIPLMLQYQSAPVIKARHQLYAAAGATIGIPVNGGKYTSTNDGVMNSGYYEYENYEYTTQTFMGFGRFEGKKGSGELFPRFQGTENIAFFASAEAGVKWQLKRAPWALYTGLYLDYGLNSIREPQTEQPFVAYNDASPADFEVNSAMNSQYAATPGAQPQAFTDKMVPIAAGIKIRIAFGKDCKKKKDEAPPATYIAPVIPDEPEEEAKPEDTTAAPVEKPDSVPATDAGVPVQPPFTEETVPLVQLRENEAAADSAEAAARLKPVNDYTVSHAELSAVQKQKWDENIAVLNMYPNMKVFIYGHTCNLGNAAINERIGKQRAETVKAYLLSKGIAADRILGTASKRDTEPTVPNDTEANRRLNRMVELVVQ
jgi:outer membrane protein OmpA-like peptidoglycan-associated protein